MSKPKVASEAEFRRSIISKARYMGCEVEVKQILDKYDNLLKYCTNKEERKSIGAIGTIELYRLLDCFGGLSINGAEVIPSEDPEDKIIKV